MNRCPCCNGEGRIGYGGFGPHPKSTLCYLCEGAGQVSEAVVARVEHGRKLSHVREKAGISLRELAKKARLNPTVLIDIEQGRAEASERIQAVYESFGKR